MSTADLAASNSTTPPAEPFRVQDNARALWGMMAVLLLSGFAVLRMLTGASDAPRVDTSGTIETTPAPSAVEKPRDDVHRLRPQTSASLPSQEGLYTAEALLTPGDGWNHLPVTHWQSLPGDQAASDAVREPELLR